MTNEYVRKELLDLIVSRVKSRLAVISRDVHMVEFVRGAEYALDYFEKYEKFLISRDELLDELL